MILICEMSSEVANPSIDKNPSKAHPNPAKKSSHSRRKRPPKRLSQKPNDVYINRNSQFAGQLARCKKLFDQGFNDINIHGLGAAIHRAINLALQLRDTSAVPLSVHSTTSTVELVDDLEPLTDEADYQTQTRPNSAIHIHLSRLSSPSHSTPSQPTTSSQVTHSQATEPMQTTTLCSSQASEGTPSHPMPSQSIQGTLSQPTQGTPSQGTSSHPTRKRKSRGKQGRGSVDSSTDSSSKGHSSRTL